MTLTTPFKILLSIAVILLIALIAVQIAIYFYLFKTHILRKENDQNFIQNPEPFANFNKKMQDGADWFHSQNPERVYITSFDGLKLCAFYLPAKNEQTDADTKGTMLLMHGFHSSGLGDFAAVVKFYHDSGFNILLPFQRTHGESEGKYITFGVKERYDCKDWITFINEKNGTDLPVYLHGVSMGCATVVMTSGFTLPRNVKGIIADCGYTSPYEEVFHVIKDDFHLPAKIITPLANIQTTLFAGFNMKKYSTLEALKTNPIPILFIHGGADTFVPTYMSEINYEACISQKKKVIFDGIEHARSSTGETEKYEQVIKDFIGF